MAYMIRVLGLLFFLASAPAVAQSDNTKAPDWKKTEKGAGSLFQGMGQEINKLMTPSKKGEDKKSAKKADDKKD